MEKKEAEALFTQLFGGQAEDLFTAAGRINVIGEHVDYCGGKVFPAALNLNCGVYGRKNGENVIRVAASDFKEVITLDIDKLDSYKGLKWGNYQAGVAYYLQESGTPIVGCDLLYDCTVPFGSGLSSSAAMEVSTAVALSEYAGVKYNKIDLALISQKAENKYAGVNCGIMDQFASAMGKKDHAILLDCSTLEYEYVPLLLGDYCLVVANCNKPHNLVESKYNVRRHEVETALKAIQKVKPEVACLAELTPKEFNEVKYVLSGVVSKRAEHVVMGMQESSGRGGGLKGGRSGGIGTASQREPLQPQRFIRSDGQGARHPQRAGAQRNGLSGFENDRRGIRRLHHFHRQKERRGGLYPPRGKGVLRRDRLSRELL